jgi:hypothetical protein
VANFWVAVAVLPAVNQIILWASIHIEQSWEVGGLEGRKPHVMGERMGSLEQAFLRLGAVACPSAWTLEMNLEKEKNDRRCADYLG